jgi:hypothetical protein
MENSKFKSSLVGRYGFIVFGVLGAGLGGCTFEGDVSEAESTESSLSGDPDQVLAWNETAMTVFASQNPPFQTRFAAIMHAAVFDAVNSVTHDHEPYAVTVSRPHGATANAAAAGAAHYALTHLMYAPPLTAAESAVIADAWAALPASMNGDSGIGLGEQVAATILALRATDGAPATPLDPTYAAPGAGNPGVWLPQPGAASLVPTWGDQATWILKDAMQFDPGSPPALDSARYLNDLAEVEALGSATQPANTLPWNIAKFWASPAAVLWNPIARNLSAAKHLGVSENARLFAMMNIAGADTAINTWKVKYRTNFWRPITAIRAGGNATWSPLLPTPPFPEFTSGHASITSAYATILAKEFGDNPGLGIVATSPTAVAGFSRNWTTFSEAVEEVINARVYSGIHYRNSDEVAARIGREIAVFDGRHAMRPNHGHRDDHDHGGHER